MYPDPITPKAHPDLLQKPDYDPFGVIPAQLPPHPRVFTTAARLARAKARLAARSPIDVACLEQLLAHCKIDDPPPPQNPGGLDAPARAALRNALAFHLTGKTDPRRRSLELLRHIAHATPTLTWTSYEGSLIESIASTYDLLAADGLDAGDDNLFRDALWGFPGRLDPGGHRRCNNHNAFNMIGRLSVGTALGHRPFIHDALYGCQRLGEWRYGLIHLLRHDFLADGMQWEGSMSYHMLVMAAAFELATLMENIGVDIWRRGFPSLMQDDCCDEHRDWGPKGDKLLKAGLDAFLYQAFPNGDYSNLHDQILGNIRGAGAWWPLFNKGYEVYGDERYAWMAQRLDREHKDPASVLPVWFRTGQGDIEFIRLECRDLPAGKFSFAEDATLSLTGRHVNGCTLLPTYGAAILRADPTREDSAAASLYFGPHNAGHRSPAALHLEVHAAGRRITHAPHLYKDGYIDPKHLTWSRSTLAHNTVTVDETPMFPYDFETQSTWEYDRWRDTLSDGELVAFQPEGGFKAARAANDNVYRGVRLDRAIALTGSLLIDVFRVTSDTIHRCDWAVHCHGEFPRPAGAESVEPGQARGYRHLTDAWRHPASAGWVALPFSVGPQLVTLQLHLPAGDDAALVLANDPPVDSLTPIGDLEPPRNRTAILSRVRAANALFVSVWAFGGGELGAEFVRGDAKSDVELITRGPGGARRWTFPLRGPVRVG